MLTLRLQMPGGQFLPFQGGRLWQNAAPALASHQRSAGVVGVATERSASVRATSASCARLRAPTRSVASIRALCHDTFEAGNFAQPLTRQMRVGRLQDQLQAWMQVGKEVLQAVSPLDEWQINEICAGTFEHVEDQQHRRAVRRGLRAAPRSHSQPSLKSADVCAPILIGDDDLAVEHCRWRQGFAGLGSSGTSQ